MSIVQQTKEDVKWMLENIPPADTRDVDGVVDRVVDELERAAWTRIAARWNQVVWKVFVFKKVRYRDLRAVWVVVFGFPPKDVLKIVDGAP